MNKILPTFSDTLTIYHQIKSKDEKGRTIITYQSSIISNCFFSCDDGIRLEGKEIHQSNQYIARLPMDTLVDQGDLIVLGKAFDVVSDTEGMRISDISEKYKPHCFTVKNVKINNKIQHLKHIKVTGV